MAHETVYKFDADREQLIPGQAQSDETVNETISRTPALLQQPVIIQAAGAGEKKWKKSYVIGITAAVLIIVMAMALVLVVVYGPLANNLNQESSTLEGDFESFKTQYQTDSEDLREEFQSKFEQLTLALNETEKKLSAAEKRIALLSDNLATVQDNSLALNTVAHSNSDTLSNLQDTVNLLVSNGTVSVYQLDSVRTQFRTQYDSLQTVVNSLNTAQHTTTTQVQDLTSRVNTPVNIYQNCSEVTRSCTFSSSSSYAKYCSTTALQASTTGYYTVDTRCEYSPSSSSSSYFVTAVVHQSSSGVYCKCGVTNPSSSSHGRVYSVYGTCYLKIKRCHNTIQH